MDFCEKGDDLTEEEKVELEGLTREMELTPTDFSEGFLMLVKTVKADLDE